MRSQMRTLVCLAIAGLVSVGGPALAQGNSNGGGNGVQSRTAQSLVAVDSAGTVLGNVLTNDAYGVNPSIVVLRSTDGRPVSVTVTRDGIASSDAIYYLTSGCTGQGFIQDQMGMLPSLGMDAARQVHISQNGAAARPVTVYSSFEWGGGPPQVGQCVSGAAYGYPRTENLLPAVPSGVFLNSYRPPFSIGFR